MADVFQSMFVLHCCSLIRCGDCILGFVMMALLMGAAVILYNLVLKDTLFSKGDSNKDSKTTAA